MIANLRPALVALALLTLLTGILYPLAVTGVGALILPGRASGSLIRVKGVAVGSALIGQAFTRPEYLHGRPSAAGDGYDPTQSGGSNLGPLDPKLADKTKAAAAAFGAPAGARIPADAVTASASGLDPDVSPENARLQAPRIARARGAALVDVLALIDRNTKGRSLGVLGEPRVNVLEVNLALDARLPRRS
jgi:K+-transporting ATPase ATPase C chain